MTEQLAKLLRAGLTVKAAVDIAGISESAFFAWMKRGELELSPEELEAVRLALT